VLARVLGCLVAYSIGWASADAGTLVINANSTDPAPRAALPLIRPAIAAVSVLVFTFVWNDYFWSLVLVQSDAVRPVTAGLQALRGMWQTSWNLVAAASLLAALPPIAVFFVMQRHLIAGLTHTAIGDR
jgi:ABC-type glycerol-3-phosphate transport system permease component